MVNRDIRDLTSLRLLILLSSFCIALLLSSLIGMGIGMIEGLKESYKLLLSSAVQCVVAFCIPAWLTARFCTHDASKWLGLNKMPGLKAFIGVVIAYALALPAFNWIVDWNQHIHLPDAFSQIEETFRNWEETNGSVAVKMLSDANVATIVTAVIVVGLLTGFSEEVFFRGALQGIFQRGNVSSFVAVWGAAAIFSALHFQFFGFIPRLLMGAFFGYLFLWSESLWLPIFAHALNNSIVVVTFNSQGGEIDTIGTTSAGEIGWLAIGSAVITLAYLYFFKGMLVKGRKR